MRSYILAKLLGHHGLIIRPVADVHPGDRVALKQNHVGADAVEEGDAASSLMAFIQLGVEYLDYSSYQK